MSIKYIFLYQKKRSFYLIDNPSLSKIKTNTFLKIRGDLID